MDIIAMMYKYSIKKDTGTYTYGFNVDKYRFCYHNHSTGRHLEISIIAPDGDQLQIYNKTEWYSASYYHNGFGKGFIDGPWVNEVNNLFEQFKKELINKLLYIRKLHKNIRENKTIVEKERISKFYNLYK